MEVEFDDYFIPSSILDFYVAGYMDVSSLYQVCESIETGDKFSLKQSV